MNVRGSRWDFVSDQRVGGGAKLPATTRLGFSVDYPPTCAPG